MSINPQEMAAMEQAAGDIFQEAKMRIIVAQFLGDYKAERLTLDEAVELVIQIWKGRKQPD